jgi:protein tyrosine phosphatase (PTP) superfamily phosphohydrolase (DUF442 family)
MRLAFRLLLTSLWLVAAMCVAADAPKAPAPAGPGTAVQIGEIHNAFRASEHVFSGSQPETDADFAAIAKLGVKTIISVDGSKPRVEEAKKHGLRYVHLPFGYDGIPPERVAELAQAAKTVPGPIFVHCHHGKHRGPAAVGVVCLMVDGWTPERAEAWLQQAGTSPDYPGLYRVLRSFQPITAERLAKVGPLPEIAKTEPLVDKMVAVDERFDVLKATQKAGWKDADGAPRAVEIAALLWEDYREMARTEDTAQRPADYRAKLAAAEKNAKTLHTGLSATTVDRAALDLAMQAASKDCSSCHKEYRNTKGGR